MSILGRYMNGGISGNISCNNIRKHQSELHLNWSGMTKLIQTFSTVSPTMDQSHVITKL